MTKIAMAGLTCVLLLVGVATQVVLHRVSIRTLDELFSELGAGWGSVDRGPTDGGTSLSLRAKYMVGTLYQ